MIRSKHIARSVIRVRGLTICGAVVPGMSVCHSATTFRNFAIRQLTNWQKRHSETIPFGKTVRQKIFGNWVIGNSLIRNQTIGNLYSAKVNNAIKTIRQNTFRKQTFGKFRFGNQPFRRKPANYG